MTGGYLDCRRRRNRQQRAGIYRENAGLVTVTNNSLFSRLLAGYGGRSSGEPCDRYPREKEPSLTAEEKLKNLTDALAEDALEDQTPLTTTDRGKAWLTKEQVLQKIEKSDWKQRQTNRGGKEKKTSIN
jgi:hypothetical protein